MDSSSYVLSSDVRECNCKGEVKIPKAEPSVNVLFPVSSSVEADIGISLMHYDYITGGLLDNFSSSLDDSLDSINPTFSDFSTPNAIPTGSVSLPSSSTEMSDCRDVFKMEVVSPKSYASSVNDSYSACSTKSSSRTKAAVYQEWCTVCGDLATGKHYGVYACEGCKGFFKRTIRRQIEYKCRENNSCTVNERLRNRCQACRFTKCLEKGMKIDAVQKERPHKRKSLPLESPNNSDESIITADNIIRNEMSSYTKINDSKSDLSSLYEISGTQSLCTIINKLLFDLVLWAKSVPGFSSLERSDQVILLNKTWVEVLITSLAFRSSSEFDLTSIRMDDKHRLTLTVASQIGLQSLLVRLISEIVTTLKQMQVDLMEIACLRMIILFDSNFGELKSPATIRNLRNCVFDVMRTYVSSRYPKQPSRIYKLLLKLSSIRSLAACFICKIHEILQECDSESVEIIDIPVSLSSTDESYRCVEGKPDVMYPLLVEMMRQYTYPFV